MKEKLSGGRLYCLISAVLLFGSYVCERSLPFIVAPSRQVWLIEALVFSLLTLVIYLLVVSSRDPYYGILMAAFGYRMMPPDIWYQVNAVSRSAGVVYFIVQKMAIVIFIFAIIKLFRLQEKNKCVTPLAVLAILFVVPFCNTVLPTVSTYLADFTGTMLYSYFAGFVLYIIAMLVLLFIGNQSTRYSGMMISDFQIVALVLNIARKGAAIVINLVNGTHLSRSYYVWVLIYAIFLVAFACLKKKRAKEPIEE